MDGIIPLWKEKGLTSHDCVIQLRRILRTKKVGHTGTLDPDVEGVLPICIGQATKIVPFLTNTKKTYVAEVTVGFSTTTEDASGNIVEYKTPKNLLSEDTVGAVLETFVGDISQVVPLYSAVKVKGRKLYEYARENIAIDRPTRTVTIEHITFIPGSLKKDKDLIRFSFEVSCSKGTYIRTLCADIGKALGYPAHMSSLVRTATGSFTGEHTFTMKEIRKKEELGEIVDVLAPISAGVTHLKRLEVDRETAQKVVYGQKLVKPNSIQTDLPFRIEYRDQLLAIYQQHPTNENEIKPVRVLSDSKKVGE